MTNGTHGRGDRPKDEKFEGRTFLLIRDDPVDDGTEPLTPPRPHWLSPDIVIVRPGGIRGGEAAVGEADVVEVTVANKGGVDAVNTEVQAFVCGPTTGWTPATALDLGTLYVTIPGYSSRIAAFPWTPPESMAGHNCLMARTRLIVPPDTYADATIFDVPNDRHVAQRNIHVLSFEEDAEGSDSMEFRFLVVNPTAERAQFELRVAERRVDRDVVRTLRRLHIPPAKPAAEPLASVQTRLLRLEDPFDVRLGEVNPRLGPAGRGDDTVKGERGAQRFELAPDDQLLARVMIAREPGAEGLRVVEAVQRQAGEKMPAGGVTLVIVD